jgi:hypothetical protein
MRPKPQTHIISLCHIDDIGVWELTSKLLPEYVSADVYTVYVPENQVEAFRAISDSRVEVLSELELDSGFTPGLWEELERVDNLKRYGWYLQQFYKLEALRQSKADLRVIWDSDCVPLRPIELFAEGGMPVFMRAEEYNGEYFALAQRWLGLRRVQNQSFVIPGFPIRGVWVNEFFEYVRGRHGGLPWHRSLLDSVDFSSASGFSEFETLGTWIANKYPSEWKSSELEWERFGHSRFGPANALDTGDLRVLGSRHGLDIVSFENWDRPTQMTRIRNRKIQLKKSARKVLRMFRFL